MSTMTQMTPNNTEDDLNLFLPKSSGGIVAVIIVTELLFSGVYHCLPLWLWCTMYRVMCWSRNFIYFWARFSHSHILTKLWLGNHIFAHSRVSMFYVLQYSWGCDSWDRHFCWNLWINLGNKRGSDGWYVALLLCYININLFMYKYT